MAFGLVQLGLSAAHLKDKQHALECVNWLVHSYWTPAFGSYHDPGRIFNVDITGGIPAVVSYMLVQSTADQINLLPCLPEEWPNGSIKGVPTRGGFVVDLKWKDGTLAHSTIRSLAGRPCKVSYQGKIVELNLKKGQSVNLDGSLKIIQ